MEGGTPIEFQGGRSPKEINPKFRICKGSNTILEKIKNRISSWKNRLLSKAGRLELIRSVLHSYSIYWCNAFLLPAGLLHDIERLLMNFFWNDTKDKAMHMVNWDNICKSKDVGGLNLRNTRDLKSSMSGTAIVGSFAKQMFLMVTMGFC